MLLTDLKHTVFADLQKVDKLIMSSLHSDVGLIQDMGKYIIQGGGKRLRPLLVLFSAKACGYAGEHQITMATVIEFIHTATLLHDDVVDGALLRRGCVTANCKWGNQAAVLVGDFLYSRAFQLMVNVQNMQILQTIANATNTIAEGEVMQLMQQRDPATSERQYLHIIRCKTAKLFEAAAAVGAVLANATPQIQNIFAQYGLHIGTAYQLIDDLLDYQATDAELGKVLGNDLIEGKATMPLIYVLQHGTAEQKELVTAAIADPNKADLQRMYDIILTSGALEYTLTFAQREAGLAKSVLAELPASPERDAAMELAEFVVIRTN